MPPTPSDTDQRQFLDVIDRDEAQRRFHAAIDLAPRGEQVVELDEALGRVLSQDVVAPVDVPSFDRSNYDGFAVRAADTLGADERRPRRLRLAAESLGAGVEPIEETNPGHATLIATGATLPRGADAVVMVEHTDTDGDHVLVFKPVAAGFGVTFAGTDITAGETVLRARTRLTSRETGLLAAIGAASVSVFQVVRVAIISTGDELIAPGEAPRPVSVFDSNARILADAVRELGGHPISLGIVGDDAAALAQRLDEALRAADVVLLSGGTSKGAGDLCYRVVERLRPPAVVAHGVALKPGKPICLASDAGKPVVILPGFPTSAVFTFHEFVAPVIRALGGEPPQNRAQVNARLAVRVNSEIGRTEFVLVGLVESGQTLAAYPMGKGSGSVTTFSRADGFITIDRHGEFLDAGEIAPVELLGRDVRVADLVAIGSHCVGLDMLISRLSQMGVAAKLLNVGSAAGLDAARRGECDVAGVHLLDPASGEYNVPFLTPDLSLAPGYRRLQGIVFRRGDDRFAGADVLAAVRRAAGDATCRMINRNSGSGTRMLIDRLLAQAGVVEKPSGYVVAANHHNAVAAAVAQGRADWGVAIQSVAERNELGFSSVADEQFDFIIPNSRRDRPAVRQFLELLESAQTKASLEAMGLRPREP